MRIWFRVVDRGRIGEPFEDGMISFVKICNSG